MTEQEIQQIIKEERRKFASMGGKARMAKLTPEEKTAHSLKMLSAKKNKKVTQ